MAKNQKKQPEIKIEQSNEESTINVEETQEIEQSNEESTELAESAKTKKVEVIQNGSFRFNKKNQF